MKKILVKNMMVLGLYGTISQCGFASSISSPVDDEAFSQKQRQAMAKLAATTQQEKAISESQIEVGDVSIRATGESKVAFVAGKSSSAVDIKLGDVDVSAEGHSKAVAILNKAGGMSSDIAAGKVSVKATENSQAYGFVDDASDW